MLVQTKEIEMKPEDVERIFQSEDYKAAAEKGLFVSFLSCYSSTIPLILPLSVFQMTVQKPVPKYFLKAREKSRARDAPGFGFACHSLKNWDKMYQPITERRICNRVISFNSHLKTLSHYLENHATLSLFPALSRGCKYSSARALIRQLQQTFERLASHSQICYHRNSAETFSNNVSLVIFPFQVLLLVSSSTARIVFVLRTKQSDQCLGIRRQAYTSHPHQTKRRRT